MSEFRPVDEQTLLRAEIERLRQQVDDARHDMCERHEAEIERLRAENGRLTALLRQGIGALDAATEPEEK